MKPIITEAERLRAAITEALTWVAAVDSDKLKSLDFCGEVVRIRLTGIHILMRALDPEAFDAKNQALLDELGRQWQEAKAKAEEEAIERGVREAIDKFGLERFARALTEERSIPKDEPA